MSILFISQKPAPAADIQAIKAAFPGEKVSVANELRMEHLLEGYTIYIISRLTQRDSSILTALPGPGNSLLLLDEDRFSEEEVRKHCRARTIVVSPNGLEIALPRFKALARGGTLS